MTQYLKLYGQQLVERGYSVIPIPPGAKRPVLEKWQTVRATAADVRKWAGNGSANDGIGVLARNTPAIDLDIEDQSVVDLLMPTIRGIFPALPPARIGRAPRLMFICRTDEPFSKVKSGKYRDTLIDATFQVEILGDGQQFVAFHTHPDTGRPYTWPGAALFDIDRDALPVLTLIDARKIIDAFEEIARVKVEAGEWERMTDGRRGRAAEDLDPNAPVSAPMGLTDDEIRAVLAAIDPTDYEDWVFTGQELHHETEGSERGLGLWDVWSQRASSYPGYAALKDKWSTFGRTGKRPATFGSTMKRAKANGWVQLIPDDFETLPALSTAEAARALPVFKRDKAGILATVDNLKMALDRPDVCGAAIRFDTFRDEIMLSEDGETGWRPFEDADYTRMRLALERGGFKPVGREIMRDVVLLAATEHKFDTAQVWLGGLKWDGKPRVERFLRDYFGAEDTPYTRGVSVYLWTALAGRVVDPGCKADMVPILVGAQGIRKSSSVAAMVPAPDFFAEIDFGEKDADLSRKMRGCLVGEIGELRGLNSKDLESIKAFITRTHEKWVPKFREFTTTFPRRLLFIGTTNQEEFLADETGNRRWLPVRVPFADRDAVARDALQLWAEARDKHAELGVCFREAEELAAEAHAAHSIHDAWEDLVRGWLDEPDMDDKPIVREFLRATDVLRDAIRLEPRNIGRREEMRIAKVFKDLGYTRKKQRIGNATAWVWVE